MSNGHYANELRQLSSCFDYSSLIIHRRLRHPINNVAIFKKWPISVAFCAVCGAGVASSAITGRVTALGSAALPI